MIPAFIVMNIFRRKIKNKINKNRHSHSVINPEVFDHCLTCYSVKTEEFSRLCESSERAFILKLITGISVHKDVPDSVCSKCADLLDSVCDFRENCLQTQRKLRYHCENGPCLPEAHSPLGHSSTGRKDKPRNRSTSNEIKDEDDVKLSELCSKKKKKIFSDETILVDHELETRNVQQDYNDGELLDDCLEENDDFQNDCDFFYSKQYGTEETADKSYPNKIDGTEDKLELGKPDSAARSYDYKTVYEDWDSEKMDKKLAKEKRALKAKMKRLKAGPHVCKYCKKVLGNVYTLQSHLKIHTGIGFKFMCESCGKQCRSRYALVTHKRAQHGFERADRCRHCDYLALNKQQLLAHERRHTGEKPYICDHCNSAFHRRANLVQHLAVHLDKKTVQCDECPSKFKSIKFLRTHKNQIHRTKEFYHICYVCSNNFSTPRNVRIHLLRIHGIPRHEQGPIARVKMRYCFERFDS